MTHQDKQRADATDWLGENYNFDDLNKREIEIGLNAWHAASEKARQQRGEAVADFPSGAIENGRAFADRLENDYSFECQGGPIRNCSDWQEFRRCFEYLAEWAIGNAPQSADPDPTLLYEQALSSLIDKIVPGLDSGDILADAQTASAALESAQPAEPVKPAPCLNCAACAPCTLEGSVNGACPLTASAEPVKLNQATRDQVAAVMLQTGTPERQEEALRYAGVEPVKGEPSESPTKGMNLGERIAHVGGRTNAQGYTEFGSPMAVNALIQHVLRDFATSGEGGAFQASYRIPGGEWSSWGHVTCGVKGHEQRLRYLPDSRQPTASAEPCHRCEGVGTITVLSDASPDAHCVEVDCDHCRGTGAASDAAKHLAADLASEKQRHMQLYGEFQNFHRSLCARFGYGHDRIHFRRDLVSLEEAIAAKISAAPVAAQPAATTRPGLAFYSVTARNGEVIDLEVLDLRDQPISGLKIRYVNTVQPAASVRPGTHYVTRDSALAAIEYVEHHETANRAVKAVRMLESMPAPAAASVEPYTSVSELKALLGKSSSGPWRLFEPAYGNDLVGIESEDPELLNEGEEIILPPSDIKRADAEFIVACRNILPLLLAAPVAAQPSVAPCKDTDTEAAVIKTIDIDHEGVRRFWHRNCTNQFGGIMKEIKRENAQSLFECLHCGAQAYYPVGGVGLIRAPSAQQTDGQAQQDANKIDVALVAKWQAEHGVSLDRGSREGQMVVLCHKQDGEPTVWCDPEIADLVDALNNGKLATVASCSGHGHRPGNIVLADGRELIIAKNYDEAREVESHFPGINGELPRAQQSGSRHD